jgi:dipeptidyl aminopeptidase/acylaminoacyl peptidase
MNPDLASRMTPFLVALTVLVSAPRSIAAVTIEQAIDPRGVLSASLSPDGKHIAAIGFSGLNHGLILIDAETLSAKTIVTGARVTEGNWIFNKEPRAVTWAGNDLLAVDYGLEAESVTLEGKKVAELGGKVIGKAAPGRPDSPMLLAYTDEDYSDVALVDARTGKRTKFREPSGKAIRRAFDKNGILRAVTMANSAFWSDVTLVSNWYKPSADAEWQKLAEFKVTDDYWVPMFVPDQIDSLIVASSQGRDTRAIFLYDTKKREIGELMAGHPTQDIVAVRGIAKSDFDSVMTTGMIPQQVWFDDTWRRLQLAVDAALPKRVNALSGNPKGRVLIYSYSDIDPGTWLLFDTVKNTMTTIARVKPSVDPTQMRPMASISYRANDGLMIPAFLTKPEGASGPAPTVVMIHGGPMVRDPWAWNAEVQLMAANGYVVFQPQFRGSEGFGRKFLEAGYGQWGLAMQDDITAGVDHLIKQGISDPKRICIAGASYGGYAALWGLVKTPSLYRCGVSFAGVADIEFMLSDSSDSNDNKITRELMRSQIGDIKLNKEKFDLVSPLLHADKIEAPLLLIHGEEDRRVPISHMKKMRSALDANHKVYEVLTFDDEGHGLQFIRNEQSYFEALLAFLGKYIGPKKPVAAKAGATSAEADAPKDRTVTTEGASAAARQAPAPSN